MFKDKLLGKFFFNCRRYEVWQIPSYPAGTGKCMKVYMFDKLNRRHTNYCNPKDICCGFNQFDVVKIEKRFEHVFKDNYLK